MSTLRTTIMLGLAAVATATVAGCSDEPQPGFPTGTSIPPLTASSPAPSTAPAKVFESVKACDLLGSAVAGEKRLGKPQVSNLGGPNGCETDETGNDFASLDLHDGKAFDDLAVDRGTLTEISVGGRDARMIAGDGGEGLCSISIAAGPVSRAVVTLVIGESTAESCELLKPIAEKVAEQLPPG